MDTYKIDEQKDYIYVKLMGEVISPTLYSIIVSVIQLTNDTKKNGIFDFREASVYIELGDLEDIVNHIKMLYPKNPIHTKTAIVVSTETNRAIATLFKEAAEELPFKIEIFDTLDSAKDWVRK
jgi:hypothetical protein